MTEPEMKNSVRRHFLWHTIVQKVVDKVKEIPNVQELRGNTELCLLVCNIVENLVEKGNKHKLDKEALVVDALNAVFSLNADEIEQVKNTVQFLWDNDKIKKLPRLKFIAGVVFQWVSKKFL